MLHKDCLLTLDGASLNIDHVIKIQCGKEEDKDIEFQYKELVKGSDYVEIYKGGMISIQIIKELLTGYIYHIKVTASLKNGKEKSVFNSIVHPRGIYYLINSLKLFKP